MFHRAIREGREGGLKYRLSRVSAAELPELWEHTETVPSLSPAARPLPCGVDAHRGRVGRGRDLGVTQHLCASALPRVSREGERATSLSLSLRPRTHTHTHSVCGGDNYFSLSSTTRWPI